MKCKYCETEANTGQLCSTCRQKLLTVREIKAIGHLIKGEREKVCKLCRNEKNCDLIGSETFCKKFKATGRFPLERSMNDT